MYTGYSVNVYSVECTCIQCILYTVYSVHCTVEGLIPNLWPPKTGQVAKTGQWEMFIYQCLVGMFCTGVVVLVGDVGVQLQGHAATTASLALVVSSPSS